MLVPSPTYPLYTAVLAKIGANPVYYRTDPAQGWLPDLDHMARAVTPKTRALVLIDPEQPDRRGLSGSGAPRSWSTSPSRAGW